MVLSFKFSNIKIILYLRLLKNFQDFIINLIYQIM
ncbi:hypothetical protein pb186bvf_011838 [Paramecium bursaria]